MKTLVYANDFGTALAQHLGCTLINNNTNGDGFVTKVDEIQDVWDNIICLDTEPPIMGATVYGYTALTHRMNNDKAFAEVMLEGAGVKLLPEVGVGKAFGALLWIKDGQVIGKILTIYQQNQLMNRDLGSQIPIPSGVVVFHSEDLEVLLSTLLPNVLKDHPEYSGPLSLSLSKTSSSMYLEDIRFGLKTGWFETAREILRKDADVLSEGFQPSRNVAVGVLASVAPWPFSSTEVQVQIPKQALDHLGILSMLSPNHSEDCTHMTQGPIGYVTAWGGGEHIEDKVRSARLRVYRTLRNYQADQLQYRTDVGSRTAQLHTDLCALQETSLAS